MKRFFAILLSLALLLALALSSCSETVSSPSSNGLTNTADSSASSAEATAKASTTRPSESTTAPTETQSPSARVGVMGVRFEKTEIHITAGSSMPLRATVLPENATVKDIDYSVTNDAVIHYENGVLYALAEGEAILTATTVEDGYVARCRVFVEKESVPTPTPTRTPTPTEPPTETPTETPVETPTPTQTPVDGGIVVCIDAGHGFENSRKVIDVGAGEGSVYNELTRDLASGGLYEADLNLQIALKVRSILEARGVKVVMTRTDYVHEYLSITARAERIRNMGVDMLVSIHANSAANPDAHGARVYYNTDPAFAKTAESKALAQAIMSSIKGNCPESFFIDYLSEGKSLAVLNGSGDIPCALVETAFLTNEGDAHLALDEVWQQRISEAIADGIIASFANI